MSCYVTLSVEMCGATAMTESHNRCQLADTPRISVFHHVLVKVDAANCPHNFQTYSIVCHAVGPHSDLNRLTNTSTYLDTLWLRQPFVQDAKDGSPTPNQEGQTTHASSWLLASHQRPVVHRCATTILLEDIEHVTML